MLPGHSKFPPPAQPLTEDEIRFMLGQCGGILRVRRGVEFLRLPIDTRLTSTRFPDWRARKYAANRWVAIWTDIPLDARDIQGYYMDGTLVVDPDADFVVPTPRDIARGLGRGAKVDKVSWSMRDLVS